jgi:hypothetical protein
MDRNCESLCETLAKHIVARDFDKAHALLAPWLRAAIKPSDIRTMIQEAGEGLPAPAAWTLDEGLAEFEDLRKANEYGPPSEPVSNEITAQNYKGWLCIQFTPGEAEGDEPNACFDLWLAVVEIGGVHCVGYLETAEPT